MWAEKSSKNVLSCARKFFPYANSLRFFLSKFNSNITTWLVWCITFERHYGHVIIISVSMFQKLLNIAPNSQSIFKTLLFMSTKNGIKIRQKTFLSDLVRFHKLRDYHLSLTFHRFELLHDANVVMCGCIGATRPSRSGLWYAIATIVTVNLCSPW